MKVKKKLIGLLLATLLVVSGVTGCSNSASNESSSTSDMADTASSTTPTGTTSSNELQKLRVAVMTGTFTQYTALIGKEQGIFEKYGIDLEITEYAAGINTIDAVVSGQADVGMMADFAVVNRIGNTLDSTNLIMFSEIQGGSVNGGLYVAPEYADNTKELDGKGFISTVGTVSEYYNSVVFKYLGLDESKQKLLNSDGSSTSLALAQSGDAAAIFTSGANGSYFEELGWKKAISGADLGISTYSYYLTTSDYNKESTQLLANFLKATQESYDYIKSNLDDTAAYLESTLGIDAKNFINDWSVAESRIGFSEEGAKQLETIAAWAYENGKYDSEYDVRKYINTDALGIAFPDKITLTVK